MIAILRYAVLKGWRDGSLIAFLLPILFPVAAMGGATLAKGHLQYPFYLNSRYTPVQNATLSMQIAFAIAFIFSTIPAFWALRTEIGTRAIGSFLLAARPFTVTSSLVVYATAVGFTGWMGALGMTTLMTSALPEHLGMMMLKAFVAAVGASAVGALAVMISAQPAMVVVAYMSCIIVFAFLDKAKDPTQLLTGIVVAVVCFPLSTFLLERRCAT